MCVPVQESVVVSCLTPPPSPRNLLRRKLNSMKVTCPAEDQVSLEFLGDGQSLSTDGSSKIYPTKRAEGGDGGAALSKPGGMSRTADTTASSDEADDSDEIVGAVVGQDSTINESHGSVDGEDVGDRMNATGNQELRSTGPDATILVRTRRQVPVISPSGQPVAALPKALFPPGATGITGTNGDTSKSQRKKSGSATAPPFGPEKESLEIGNGSRSEGESTRAETLAVVVHVYWEGAARDRAHIEVYPAKDRGKRVGVDNCLGSCLHLSVRVPTLAIVDAKAATKFAERVAQQVTIEMDDDSKVVGGGRGGQQQQQQQHQRVMKLRLPR